MATTHGVLPAERTVNLDSPCPECGGLLTVYLFVYTVGAERKDGALRVNLEADFVIGPHACREPAPVPQAVAGIGGAAR